jgi:sterol 3beta-glucosyltransferase
MMNITIIAFGTRGDVQPFLALGQGLERAGYQVSVVAGANFESWIEQHGLKAANSSVDIQSVMEGDAAKEWVQRGNSPIVNVRMMKQMFAQYGRALMMDAWQASQGADAVISSTFSDVFAVSIAEKLQARHISAWMQPATVATRSGAAMMDAPFPDRNSRLNYLFGKWLVEPFLWNMCGNVANRLREEVLNLPAQTREENTVSRRRILVLYGYSRHVIPPPEDWPPNLHTTGYWFLSDSETWQPPEQLLRFLAAGDPPVCIGFGSMTGDDPGALTDLFVQAVQQSQTRAILLSGWAGIGAKDLPSNILRLDAAPHAWLYPRMRAVVHHGGAGTTAASLRAGIPTIVVPHLADQSFWGKRVELLGVGPRAIPREKLTAAALAAAIQTALSDEHMKQRAAALGTHIRAEDGVGRAVELIKQYLDA